jgi:hypothetical protein
MKRTYRFGMLCVLIALGMLAACGGGGGGGGAAAAPTKAVITLSSSGTLAPGTQIGAIEATINLPADVTAPQAVPLMSLVTSTDVVNAAGSAAGAEFVYAVYSATTVTVDVAKSTGFSTGDFAQVTCDIVSGHRPAAKDFSMGDVTVKDLGGATIPGITVTYTAVMQ